MNLDIKYELIEKFILNMKTCGECNNNVLIYGISDEYECGCIPVNIEKTCIINEKIHYEKLKNELDKLIKI